MDDKAPKYQILDQFVANASNTLYRAQRMSDEALVLLKMPEEQASSNQLIRNLKQEIELVDGLAGEYIPDYIGVEEYNGKLVLVSRDPGGELLAKIIHSGTLSLKKFLEIALAITKALVFLHNQKIVHKGVNPSTIFYDNSSKQISFVDLSFARGLGWGGQEFTSADSIQVDSIQSALPYISPEQTGRMNRPVDYRTDFYSLGATFFEMLTQHPPFEFEDAMETVHAHLAKKIPDFEAPEAIQKIVGKLMRKQAENRYQTMTGLLADLEKCWELLQTHGSITPFEIGKTDQAGYFIIPDKLYGRDSQIKLLADLFKVTCEGHTELVFIAGRPGIGKSSLVKEFQKDVLSTGVRFIEGKFEELKRDIPYLGILKAIQSLIRQLLTESEEKLERWKKSMQLAVGINGQVLINVLPELERVIGPQSEVAALPPSESQDRFIETFKHFMRAVVSPKTPLILFLDDLQWADRASLNLVSEFLKSSANGGLLLIGGYRDNEVDAVHPLTLLQNSMRQSKQHWTFIELSYLPIKSINQLVSETLSRSVEPCIPLSKAILSKTGGNPFYVHKFMGYLYEIGLIRFQEEWVWDLKKILNTGVTENVVEFMAERIKDLSDSGQEILKYAACIGAQPNLELLSMLLARSEEEVRSLLEEPLQEGMMVFRDNVPFFIHDRVQEGAYSLLKKKEARQLHFKLGTYLLDNTPEDSLDDTIFTIINHLNEAGDLVKKENLHKRTAELNLKAGMSALRSASFELALQASSYGLQLLGDKAWDTNYDLTANLNVLRSEALYVINDFDAYDELFNNIQDRFKEKGRKLRLLELKVLMLAAQSEQAEAVRIGLEAVRAFGLDFPEAPEEVGAAIGQEMQTIEELMAGRKPADLLDAPTMEDQDMALVSRLILRIQPSAHDYGRPDIAAMIALKNASLTLKHGNSPVAPGVFAFYAAMIVFITGDSRKAYAFSRLAIDLDAKQGYLSTAQTSFLHIWLINHWVYPMSKVLDICLLGGKAGYDMGDVLFGSYITAGYVVLASAMGMQLEELITVAEKHAQIIDNRVEVAAFHCVLDRQMAKALTGQTIHRLSFTDDKYDDEQDVASIINTQNQPQIGYYHCYRSRLHYFYWDYEKALSEAEEAMKWLEACRATTAEFEIVFSYLLALTASAHQADEQTRKERISKAKELLEKIKAWSDDCEANFTHKLLLGQAELTWLDGNHEQAVQLYNKAAASAKSFNFTQYAALAHESAGNCYHAWGDHAAALGHLVQAASTYQKWGALEKVKHLTEQYPELANIIKPASTQSLRLHESLDFNSVLKAAQAISGEMEPDQLYQRVMSSLIENAGAERAIIVLKKDDEWDIVASDSQKSTGHAQTGDRSVEIPQSIFDFVERSHEYLVLENAFESNQFNQDEYIKRHEVKSVICAPILLQNELTGMIYMENNLMPAAFTESRLEVVRILSSQAAISIRHAQIYNEQVLLAVRMEELVTERTKELRKSLDDLKTTQEQLIQSEKMASLGRMSAGIAHELKNPLNFVSNFAKLNHELMTELSTELVKGQNEISEDLLGSFNMLTNNSEQIVKHSERADNIVSSLVHHSHKRGTERESTALHALLDQCIGVSLHQTQRDSEDSGIQIVRDYDANIDLINLGAQDISQVFVNLILNAFQAMDKKQQHTPKSYVPKLFIKTVQKDEEIHISFSDNGAGIPEEIHAHVFEPFFTTYASQSHSGLGLTISYDIITKGHQGKIFFNSTRDEGTSFTVVLPKN